MKILLNKLALEDCLTVSAFIFKEQVKEYILSILLRVSSHIHLIYVGYAGGQAYKRHDFVDFPKVLDMESYTHSSLTRRMKSFENIYKNQFSSNQKVSNKSKSIYHQSLEK